MIWGLRCCCFEFKLISNLRFTFQSSLFVVYVPHSFLLREAVTKNEQETTLVKHNLLKHHELSSYTQTHTHPHTHTDTQTHTHAHIHAKPHTHTRTQPHPHTHTHAHTHTRTHAHTHTRKHTHTHTNTRTHKHTHTHMRKHSLEEFMSVCECTGAYSTHHTTPSKLKCFRICNLQSTIDTC